MGEKPRGESAVAASARKRRSKRRVEPHRERVDLGRLLAQSMGSDEEGVVRGARWQFLHQESLAHTGTGLRKLVEENFL